MNKLRLFLCMLTLLAFSLGPIGCGKTDNPRPREITRSFAWQDVAVSPAGSCLDIRALMSGVYSNLDSVLLEFADVADSDCPGCPFVAEEQIQVPDLGKSLNHATGELRFSHCPRVKAPAYRLRLVGINIYDISRHAVSPVIYLEMPDQTR